MTIDELYELLEIDSADNFEFFEHFAEIIESDEDIPFAIYYQLFSAVDNEILSELVESYFEDMLKYIPDEHIDLYTLLNSIGQTLYALASNLDTENNLDTFSEELFKFRNWYHFDSVVVCKRKRDGHEIESPISEALTLYRLENLNEEQYDYDFSEVMDYPLEEYIVPLSSLDDMGEIDEFIDEDELLNEI